MTRAIENLKTNFVLYKDCNILIIDGLGWEKKFSDYTVKSVVKGDSTYLSIAASSIIAKEYHDEYIKQLCLDNPELNVKYNLTNNMGYGTKLHLEGIQKYGPCNIHRKSFNPIRDMLKLTNFE